MLKNWKKSGQLGVLNSKLFGFLAKNSFCTGTWYGASNLVVPTGAIFAQYLIYLQVFSTCNFTNQEGVTKRKTLPISWFCAWFGQSPKSSTKSRNRERFSCKIAQFRLKPGWFGLSFFIGFFEGLGWKHHSSQICSQRSGVPLKVGCWVLDLGQSEVHLA